MALLLDLSHHAHAHIQPTKDDRKSRDKMEASLSCCFPFRNLDRVLQTADGTVAAMLRYSMNRTNTMLSAIIVLIFARCTAGGSATVAHCLTKEDYSELLLLDVQVYIYMLWGIQELSCRCRYRFSPYPLRTHHELAAPKYSYAAPGRKTKRILMYLKVLVTNPLVHTIC